MGYRLDAQDEYPHAPSAEPHFNESVYCNGFDSRTGAGGWMRLGNRVNEGYAELSVCLYLPDGRVEASFPPSPGEAGRHAFALDKLARRGL